VERRRRVEEAGISLAPDCPFRSLVPGTVEPGFGGARTSDPVRENAAITSVLHGETSEELGELVKELQLSLE